MLVGEKVKKHAISGESPRERGKVIEGVCVYIHPERRFYTLRFDFLGGSFSESFPITTRRGKS